MRNPLLVTAHQNIVAAMDLIGEQYNKVPDQELRLEMLAQYSRLLTLSIELDDIITELEQ